MRSILLLIGAIVVGIAVIQLANGFHGTLVGMRTTAEGFTPALSHLRRLGTQIPGSDLGSRRLGRGLPLSECFATKCPKGPAGDQMALDVEDVVDLSRFRSALESQLNCLSFECQRAFPSEG